MTADYEVERLWKKAVIVYVILRCATCYLKGLKAILEVPESADNFWPNS
jgi:hypothetical protein